MENSETGQASMKLKSDEVAKREQSSPIPDASDEPRKCKINTRPWNILECEIELSISASLQHQMGAADLAERLSDALGGSSDIRAMGTGRN